ncbi:MAG: gamma-glutamylcyclotransferase [Acidimicrobiia bacterium]
MTASRCFLYGALLDPSLIADIAPGACFERIAHLPAHRLGFGASGTPVVVPDEGHTVWGGVFNVSEAEISAIADAYAESDEPSPAWAVDREGDRFEVLVFSGADGGKASEADIDHMVRGARHWELPAGWVVGLEDLIDPFEF